MNVSHILVRCRLSIQARQLANLLCFWGPVRCLPSRMRSLSIDSRMVGVIPPPSPQQHKTDHTLSSDLHCLFLLCCVPIPGYSGPFQLDSPCTAERIRMCCCDEIISHLFEKPEDAASYRAKGSF